MIIMEFTSEMKKMMANLTEKYHLLNEEDGLLINLGEIKIKVIDFSKIENLLLLDTYDKKKGDINKGIDLLGKYIQSTDKSESNNETIQKLMIVIADVSSGIFYNMFRQDTSSPNEKTSFKDVFKDDNFMTMVTKMMDLINCIDIAIYLGIKQLDKEIKKGSKNIANITNDPDIVELISDLKRTITSLQNENNDEVKSEYDLNNIKPIGNA